MNLLPSAKATCPLEVSDSIVVSFEARWDGIFLKGGVLGFIRKRLPRTTQPKWVYAYFGTPLSRISFKAEIKSISEVPVSVALARARDLSISREEINEYCTGLSKIGLCLTGTPIFARHKVEMKDLRSAMSFFPPQSFLTLSKDAKKAIEAFGRFR